MEGADQLLKEREYYINKDYKILDVKETRCKGGTPALLPVNIMNMKGKKWRKKKKEIKKM